MLILGVADNHDSGAALVGDSSLLAACSQERIDRVKCSGAFPWGAIDAVLDKAGVKAREVDRVVFGTDLYSPPLGRRISHLIPQILESSLTDDEKALVLGGNARRLFGLS